MKKRRAGLLIAVLALGAVALTTSPATTQEGEEEAPSCEATFSPPSVRTGSEEASVVAELSENIGPIEEIEAQDESGVVVGDFEIGEDDSVIVVLATEDAADGMWSLTFTGEYGVCAGKIVVLGDQPAAQF